MSLRLIYFDFPFWRAEASRLALHLGGIAFDDVRPDRDTFRKAKAAGDYPYGQLPVLEVDGVQIAQSAAIAVYCGKLAGLYPSDDPLAAAQVDELLATANQITGLVSLTMRVRDPEQRAAEREELATDTLPLWLGRLEVRLEANTQGPFWLGGTMTVGDLALWRLLDWLSSGMLDGIPTSLVDPYPCLRRLMDAVGGNDEVRGWMARYDTSSP